MRKVLAVIMSAVLVLVLGSMAFAATLEEFKAAFPGEMTVDEVSERLAEINGEDMSMIFMGLDGDTTMAEMYETLDNDAEIKDQFEQILQMGVEVQ